MHDSNFTPDTAMPKPYVSAAMLKTDGKLPDNKFESSSKSLYSARKTESAAKKNSHVQKPRHWEVEWSAYVSVVNADIVVGTVPDSEFPDSCK